MNKFLKFMLVLFAIFIIMTVSAVFTVKHYYQPQKIKLMVQNYVRENLKREIDFSSLSLSLRGLVVKDFRMSESTTFAQGTFAEAKKAFIKLDLMPLLHKRFVIKSVGFEGLNISLIKNADGKFNFDDLIEAGSEAAKKSENENENSAPLDLTADIIYFKNSSVSYVDKMSGRSFVFRGVDFRADNFDFSKDFKFNASFFTDVKTSSLNLPAVKISFGGKCNLALMRMSDAGLEFNNFDLAYKTADIKFSGSVNNFDNPKIVLKGSLKGIDSNLLSEFMKKSPTAFSLPEIGIDLNAVTDIERDNTKLNNLKISLGNSYIVTQGNLDYSSPQFKYETESNISVSLEELGRIAKDLLSKYALKGSVSGNLRIASGANMTGSLEFDNFSAILGGKEFKNLNGTVTLNSLDDIRTNLVTGFLAGSPFKTSFTYSKRDKLRAINAFFDMDRFALDDVNFDALLTGKNKKDKKSSAPQTAAARGNPYNIKADITVHKVSNNIFSTDNLKINVDVKNFDNIMDRTQGTLSFSASNGEIRDIDKLMSSSVVAKVLFTSVRVVQKALNFIKMDKMSIGLDKITYSEAEGVYSVNNGVITIKKSVIYSDLTTVKALGTINLVTGKLDMKVESHLGKVTSKGFKPVVIKVGGTLDDPSFKFDVVSTVTSVLNIPGSILKGGISLSTGVVKGVATGAKEIVKGAASGTGQIVKGAAGGTIDIVKGVASGITGLFKKDKPEKEEDGGK